MEKFLEFDVVIFLSENEAKIERERERLEELGLYAQAENIEEDLEEKFVKYCFDYDIVIEIKQTLVKYKNDWLDAVVCLYKKDSTLLETPALVTSYSNFKKLIEERDEKHNKESVKAE